MALLQDDFWSAIFRDNAGCEAIAETRGVPSCSDHIASCFLELERLNQELRSKLHDDFLNILNGMGSISLSSEERPPSPPPTPPSPPSSLTHRGSFTTEAYSWLLENTANPYPSPAVKASLAQRYNCSLSAINSWFINARRRMGWTVLCRKYFNNCRADALDAAHCALVKEDPNRQLPADIVHAFISVKATLEDLYSSTLTKSALSTDIDTVIKDMPDQDGVPVNKQKRSEREPIIELTKASVVDPQNKKLVAQSFYPSPDHSPFSSPTTALHGSLMDESEGDEGVSPPTLAGRKRCFSSSEEVHAPISESSKRPTKRSRVSSLADADLPSPATSTEEFLQIDEMSRSIPIIQGSTTFKSRKRRLSDAGGTRSPKHPRDSIAEPRLDVVLDPLPLSALESERSIDEWFKANFDNPFALPPPVDVIEPDHSVPWEVELFNDYTIPDDLQNFFTPAIPANVCSADLTALEDMLQSLENGRFAAPPGITNLSTATLAPEPVSKDLSLLPDFSEIIDWTALLNEDPSLPISKPMIPQSYFSSALPEIDLSVLQLPQVWTTVTS